MGAETDDLVADRNPHPPRSNGRLTISWLSVLSGKPDNLRRHVPLHTGPLLVVGCLEGNMSPACWRDRDPTPRSPVPRKSPVLANCGVRIHLFGGRLHGTTPGREITSAIPHLCLHQMDLDTGTFLQSLCDDLEDRNHTFWGSDKVDVIEVGKQLFVGKERILN